MSRIGLEARLIEGRGEAPEPFVDVPHGFTRLQYPVSTCCTFTGGYLTNDHIYEFKVTTAGQGGQESAPSNVVSARPVAAPGPPTNLTAVAGNGEAVLTWTASSTPDAWYWVYMRDASTGQSFTRLKYPVSTCCSFTAGWLTKGHTYEFKVTAFNSRNESAATNVASARPLPPFPQPPTNLTATAAGDGKVTLRWTASTTKNVWYWIELRAKGGSWQRLKYPLSTCCTFTAGYLINGTTYEFRVRSTNAAGDSTPSNVASARPTVPLTQQPYLNGASNGTNTSFLWWTAVPNAAGYWVEMMNLSARESTWTRLQYPVLSTQFQPGLLSPGTWYRWRVVPFNGAQVGTPSAWVEIRTRGSNWYTARNALGDSYSSGLGAGHESSSCGRPPYAWPRYISVRSLGTYHIACAGAKTPNVYATQLDQLSLPHAPTVITMTIGGNDVGFADELTTCIKNGDCTDREGAIASRIDNMRGTLEGLYRNIRYRAPGADIVVAGYPLLIAPPTKGKCDLVVAIGLSDDEHRMIRRLGARLNSVIKSAAAAAGVAVAVDEVVAEFAGHEACIEDEYINQVGSGAIFGGVNGSFHPNGDGQAAYTRGVNNRIGALERYGAARR